VAELTQSLLKELFSYHPDGYLVRNRDGKAVESTLHKGHRYARISVKNKAYAVHRIVFLWHHGYMPKVTDHIDNDRLNNRIENLREVTHQQNAMNKKRDFNSASPYKGVLTRKRKSGKLFYEVYVCINRQRKFFGGFQNIELANQKAISIREQYHGQFARHA
jgi:hypothetical protein